jgi:hypothetical protein
MSQLTMFYSIRCSVVAGIRSISLYTQITWTPLLLFIARTHAGGQDNVSIRQYTSVYVSIRQHTSAYVRAC